MVFIDHAKSCYAPDTKLILESGTLHNGSLLVADNVLVPGVPEYLVFTESHPQFQIKRLEASINGSWLFTDALSVAEF
jgi:catechol O-methyltransferase